jgi:hypothetical protein
MQAALEKCTSIVGKNYAFANCSGKNLMPSKFDFPECQDYQSEASSETVTSQEQQTQIIYTNGYVDPQNGPVFYLNGKFIIN